MMRSNGVLAVLLALCLATAEPRTNNEIDEDNLPDFTVNDTIVLLIDVQHGPIYKWIGYPDALNRALFQQMRLAKFAEQAKMSLIYTTNMEADDAFGTMHWKLAKTATHAFADRIKRNGTINAWKDPNFVEAVVRTGKKNLVLAGVMTDLGVAQTAVSASKAGYRVKAILDACYGSEGEVIREVMEGDEVSSTSTFGIIGELTQNWNTETGRMASAMLSATVYDLERFAYSRAHRIGSWFWMLMVFSVWLRFGLF